MVPNITASLDRVQVLLSLALETLHDSPDAAQHYIGNAAQIIQGLRETADHV